MPVLMFYRGINTPTLKNVYFMLFSYTAVYMHICLDKKYDNNPFQFFLLVSFHILDILADIDDFKQLYDHYVCKTASNKRSG